MEKNLINFGESRIVLSKDSTEEQIRAYFEGILKLYQSDEDFPVDLDDVWPLVYVRKDVAVSVLKKKFVEGIDYQVFQQKMENLEGGRPSQEYHLTTSCLEYFIARKVRSVFNVYREVFNQVATGKVQVVQRQMSAVEMFALQAQINLEQDKRIGKIESELDELRREREENTRLIHAAEVSNKELPEESESSRIRTLVNTYVKATGMDYKEVWDTMYETLEMRYHRRVKACNKLPTDKSWLDVAIRTGCGEYLYIIISNMVKNLKS